MLAIVIAAFARRLREVGEVARAALEHPAGPPIIEIIIMILIVTILCTTAFNHHTTTTITTTTTTTITTTICSRTTTTNNDSNHDSNNTTNGNYNEHPAGPPRAAPAPRRPGDGCRTRGPRRQTRTRR